MTKCNGDAKSQNCTHGGRMVEFDEKKFSIQLNRIVISIESELFEEQAPLISI